MPSTNLLKALINLSTSTFKMPAGQTAANRITTVGAPLECFIRDAFCGSSNIADLVVKEAAHRAHLSYLGNSKNPPDFMIRGGDAVEVKQIQNPLAVIALNSSYPKDKLYANDPMISNACREAEAGWAERDVIYAICATADDRVLSVIFVYGICYAANRGVYERVKRTVTEGIAQVEDVVLAKTGELARVNEVDPLGITYLRVRGMWGIENPRRVFADLNLVAEGNRPLVAAIMLAAKYESFPEEERLQIMEAAIRIGDVEIRDPNNPAHMLNAKLIIV